MTLETQPRYRDGTRKVFVQVRLDAELARALDAFAAKHKASRSEIIRAALRKALNAARTPSEAL